MATIKGRMVYIYPTQQLTSKSGNAFQKRDFVFAVQRFDPDTGEVSVDEDNTPHALRHRRPLRPARPHQGG